MISSTDLLGVFLGDMLDHPDHPPALYIDLEGANLSRTGSVSLMTIYVQPINQVFLVDVFKLQHTAFSTPSVSKTASQASLGTPASGQTLKTILENPAIPKVFFDVRNDSDALYSHYGIKLQGIVDIQLMENATRTGAMQRKRFLSGLGKCIDYDLNLSFADKTAWKDIKDAGPKLFAPEKGGSYEVFNERPLKPEIVDYCTHDVTLLPRLWQLYNSRMARNWAIRVDDATKARVVESQQWNYQPHGKHKALGPWQV